MNHSTDTLWKIYENINEWIRFADTKASAIIGVNAILAGFVVSNLPAFRTYLVGNPLLATIAILTAISNVVSVYFAVKCLNPTLDVGEPISFFYFAHIALGFDSAEKYSLQLQELLNNQSNLYDNIASQIWANSKIAWKKYKAVT